MTMATPHNIDADRARVIGTSPMRNRNTNHRTIGSHYDRTSPIRNRNTNRTVGIVYDPIGQNLPTEVRKNRMQVISTS